MGTLCATPKQATCNPAQINSKAKRKTLKQTAREKHITKPQKQTCTRTPPKCPPK
jgi:hypothetical protein